MLKSRESWKFLNNALIFAALVVAGTLGFLALRSRTEARRIAMPTRARFTVVMATGKAAAAQGDMEGAEATFQAALAERPGSLDARLYLAKVEFAQGRARAAFDLYAPVIRTPMRKGMQPVGDADTLASYGDVALALGRRSEAEAAYRMAAERPAAPAGVGMGGIPNSGVSAPGSFTLDHLRLSALEGEADQYVSLSLARVARDPKATIRRLGSAAHVSAAHWCRKTGWGHGTTIIPPPLAQAQTAARQDPTYVLAQDVLAFMLATFGRSDEAKRTIEAAVATSTASERTNALRWRELVALKTRVLTNMAP